MLLNCNIGFQLLRITERTSQEAVPHGYVGAVVLGVTVMIVGDVRGSIKSTCSPRCGRRQ
jgi:hypothetical protein